MTKKIHSEPFGIYTLLTLVSLLGVFLFFFGRPYTLLEWESVKVYDRSEQLIYDQREEYRQTTYKRIEDVPTHLKNFLLWKEDRRFYDHYGIDFKALVRAAWASVHDSVQGGSTIDQQVIKLTEQQFYGRGIARKLYEMKQALNINFWYTKDEIFLAYVNNIHFPYGAKGYETACQLYFRLPCADLSTEHLIYLHARSKFNVRKDVARYTTLIANLYDIDVDEDDIVAIHDSVDLAIENNAPHYTKFLLNSIDSQEKSSLTESLSEVHTTYSLPLHEKIQNVLEQFRPYLNDKGAHDACVVVLEGTQLVSMNLLKPYSRDGSFINGCLRPRQVGSSMKPLLYAQAFKELGLDADSLILDDAVSFDSIYGVYEPKNFDLEYHGEVSLGHALGSSLNVPAVKLLDQVGLPEFYAFLAERSAAAGANVNRDDDYHHYGLALALGVKEIAPLEFAKMRSLFVTCSRATSNPFCREHGEAMAEVLEILSTSHYRNLGFPSPNRLDVDGAYGKTGTSRHFIDGWVCGGQGPYTVCVWVGNYDISTMRASGHDMAGPIWHEIMEFVLK